MLVNEVNEFLNRTKWDWKTKWTSEQHFSEVKVFNERSEWLKFLNRTKWDWKTKEWTSDIKNFYELIFFSERSERVFKSNEVRLKNEVNEWAKKY